MPDEGGQPDRQSEDVLLKNFAWAQTAWLAKMARQEGSSVGEAPQKKLIEWMGKWREDSADASTAAERYPFPNGLLAGNALHESRINSQNLRRSLAAYEERTGEEARALDIDAFRAAAGPLVRESKRTERVFSEKLLDLVAAQGGEHSVIFTPGRVLKVTEPDTAGGAVTFASDGEPGVFHAMLPEYVRQMEQNVALVGDDTKIEGVIFGADGEIRIVTSQTAVHGTVPSYEEIDRELCGNGFLPVKQEWVLGQEGYEMWWNPETNVAIADAKTANLVKTASGEIVPIDVKAFQPAGKALEWMKARTI